MLGVDIVITCPGRRKT